LKRIAIVTTHPIQYYVPLFALMAKQPELDIMVYYTWGESCLGEKYDPDFCKEIEWDIPLLDGYKYTFLKNTSKEPGSHHFRGIINPTLIQEIEVWAPDAVWVWGWAFDSHLKAMRYFKGKVPVWFRGDSTLLDEPKGWNIRKYLRRIFLCWVYRHVDICLYTGTANRAYYKRHGVREDQLVYAPHSVDNDRFAADDQNRNTLANAWRNQLGILDDDAVFLFAGKLESKKGLKSIIEAFKILENLKARLVIAGNGVLEAELRQLASCDGRIIFLPFQNQQQMPILYRLGDVFVLPSEGPSETWGLSVNEAMACGRPVIVSDRCGCAADLVQPGVNGYCFSAGNVAQLATVMQQCLDPDNRNKMGETSRQIIARFSYDQIVDVILGSMNIQISKHS
jgi:glycosyltransferase involved in cell wall biosynthesis